MAAVLDVVAWKESPFTPDNSSTAVVNPAGQSPKPAFRRSFPGWFFSRSVVVPHLVCIPSIVSVLPVFNLNHAGVFTEYRPPIQSRLFYVLTFNNQYRSSNLLFTRMNIFHNSINNQNQSAYVYTYWYITTSVGYTALAGAPG